MGLSLFYGHIFSIASCRAQWFPVIFPLRSPWVSLEPGESCKWHPGETEWKHCPKCSWLSQSALKNTDFFRKHLPWQQDIWGAPHLDPKVIITEISLWEGKIIHNRYDFYSEKNMVTMTSTLGGKNHCNDDIYWGNLRLFKVWMDFSVNTMLGKKCIMRQEIMTWLGADERNDMRDCDLFILKGCCCTTHGCLKPEPYFKYNSTALCMYKSLMNTCDMTFDLRRSQSFLIRLTAPGILPTHLIIWKRFAEKKLPFYERSKQAGKQPQMGKSGRQISGYMRHFPWWAPPVGCQMQFLPQR